MNITRISESELRTIVENVVSRFQMESITRQAPRLRTYGLNPSQQRMAEEIALRNKRTVNNCEIRYANEYAREWMQTSEDERERRFQTHHCIQKVISTISVVAIFRLPYFF